MDTFYVQKLRPQAVVPTRATAQSAGYDLYACLDQPITLDSGETAMVATGIALEITQPQVGGFVFARSGLATRHGLGLANGVGVIDADYRGEVLVALRNYSQQPYTVAPGERIAQLVFLPVCTPQLIATEQLGETGRGAGGFGSTDRF